MVHQTLHAGSNPAYPIIIMWKENKPLFSGAKGTEIVLKEVAETPKNFKEIFEEKKVFNVRSAKEIKSKSGGIKHKEADNSWMFEGRKAK